MILPSFHPIEVLPASLRRTLQFVTIFFNLRALTVSTTHAHTHAQTAKYTQPSNILFFLSILLRTHYCMRRTAEFVSCSLSRISREYLFWVGLFSDFCCYLRLQNACLESRKSPNFWDMESSIVWHMPYTNYQVSREYRKNQLKHTCISSLL